MVHAGCVFVAGIHQSMTWMSGSFVSVLWNACVHRLDLSLHSHPKEYLGNGVRTHVNSKVKIALLEKFSSEEDQTHNIASSRTASPTCYQRAIPAPCGWLILTIFFLHRLRWRIRTSSKAVAHGGQQACSRQVCNALYTHESYIFCLVSTWLCYWEQNDDNDMER